MCYKFSTEAFNRQPCYWDPLLWHYATGFKAGGFSEKGREVDVLGLVCEPLETQHIDMVMHLHYHSIYRSFPLFGGIMSNTIFISESTLTDRYQTTVPDPVRKALHLTKREKIRYTVQADGQVLLSRAEQHNDDPILGQFLSFLAQDIKDNPQHLSAIDKGLVKRLQALVADVELDLDSPLSDEDE